ncbi:MAG: porin [Planctomycetota bacterium]
MNKGIIGIVGLCVLLAGAPAWAETSEPPETPTHGELLERLELLEREIQKLRAEQREQTRHLSVAEIDAAVQQVLEDAGDRSVMPSFAGATAGYDTTFFLQSEDGAFKLKPYFLLQFRGAVQFDDEDETESGFELRRTRFGFLGHALEKVKYFFLWESLRDGGRTRLLYAFGDVPLGNGWTMRFGQFKDPGSIEWNTSATRQLAVDRSLVNNVLSGFNIGFVQGVTFTHQTDTTRVTFGYTDGVNTFNTPFTGGSDPLGDGDFGLTARADYKPFGSWKSTADLSAVANPMTDPTLLLSLSASHTGAGDETVTFVTADMLAKSGDQPLVFFAAVHALQAELDLDTGTNVGGVVQVGYGVTEQVEVFGRAGITHLDSSDLDPTGAGTYPEFTAGFNRFFNGHKAKFTFDATLYPEGAPRTISGIGVFGNDNTQVVIRGQIQLQL